MIPFSQFLKEAPTKYTNSDLRRIMMELNVRLFQNELDTTQLPIIFKSIPKSSGAVAHAIAKIRRVAGRRELVDAAIHVSPRNYTEEVLRGLIAHEMIHVILYQRGDFVTKHEGEFERLRKQAELKANFSIPVTHSTSDNEFDPASLKEVITISMESPSKTTFGVFKFDGNTPPTSLLAQYQTDITKLLQDNKFTKVTIGTTKTIIQKTIPISRAMKSRLLFNQFYSRPSSNPPNFEWIKVFMELSV